MKTHSLTAVSHTFMAWFSVFVVFLCAPVGVSAAPKFILTGEHVTHTRGEAQIITPIQMESELGFFPLSRHVGVTGMDEPMAYSREWHEIAIYTSEAFGLPYEYQAMYEGNILAAKDCDGYQGRALWGYSSPFFPFGAGTHIPDGASIDLDAQVGEMNTVLGAESRERTFSRTNSISGNLAGPTRFFDEYPGVTYRRVRAEGVQVHETRDFTFVNFDCPVPPSSTQPRTLAEDTSVYIVSVNPPNSPRRRTPGPCRAQSEKVTCSGEDPDESFSGSVCASSGDLLLTLADPVRTRGYPLRNNIHLNSQTVEGARAMGNATFSYDIHVTQQLLPPLGGGTPVMHWVLVDGNGARYIFGPTSSDPDPEPGVFSTLATTANGYTLTQAGPPESIDRAGNFSYTFDSNGALLTITDPNFNEQELVYSSGKLTGVVDLSSSRTLTFEYTGDLITRVVENGGAIETNIVYTSGNVTEIEVVGGAETVAVLTLTYDSAGRIASYTRDNDEDTTHTVTYREFPSIEPGETVSVANVSDAKGSTLFAHNVNSPIPGATRVTQMNKEGASFITTSFLPDTATSISCA